MMPLRSKNWAALTPEERIARVELWRERCAEFGNHDRHLLAAVHAAEKQRETRLRSQRERFRKFRAGKVAA